MKGRFAPIALAALLAAGPAAALDTASGVYEGKVACRALVAGASAKVKGEVILAVSNTGTDLVLTGNAPDELIIDNITGFVAADAAKADRGAFGGYSCANNGANGTGMHGELVIKSNGKATLKGTVIQVDSVGNAVRICTITAKRTSVNAPPIPPCVPLP